MLRYMLDTDISSYFINGSHPTIDLRMRELGWAPVCISTITRGELLFGVEISPRRQKQAVEVGNYLKYGPVLDFNAEATDEYAVIRGDLHRSGKLIGNSDMLIAGHARSLGLTLVTKNVHAFSRAPGLQMENWAETV